MGNRRIHEFASEWGIKSREILDHLEKKGVTGKKAQSSLSEDEAARIYDEIGLAKRPLTTRPIVTRRKVAIHRPGEHTSVAAYDEITETRVKRGVLLRRTKRTEVGPGGTEQQSVSVLRAADARLSTPTMVDLSPEMLGSFDRREFASVAGSWGGGAAVAEKLPVEELETVTYADEPEAVEERPRPHAAEAAQQAEEVTEPEQDEEPEAAAEEEPS